jgi:hypothetical protein
MGQFFSSETSNYKTSRCYNTIKQLKTILSPDVKLNLKTCRTREFFSRLTPWYSGIITVLEFPMVGRRKVEVTGRDYPCETYRIIVYMKQEVNVTEGDIFCYANTVPYTQYCAR